MKLLQKITFLCFFVSGVAFAQTGPDITVENMLQNCQIQVTFFQINTTTMDCGALVTTSFGLGVLSSQTISPMPGHAFVRAFVQKGGGTPACFNALIEPNTSPCDIGSIDEGEYFSQCCPSSLGGGTYVRWLGGMAAPTIEIGNM